MYDLYLRGCFGNKLRTWRSIQEYEASDFSQPVSIRYRGDAGGRWFAYNIARQDVQPTLQTWVAQGAELGRVTINEVPPDNELLLQGEVSLSVKHYDLRYSYAKTNMREALRDHQLHANGVIALTVMKAAMDDASWWDLQTLFDRYTDSVVEFSVWSRYVGDIPFRNTVFWEVRNY